MDLDKMDVTFGSDTAFISAPELETFYGDGDKINGDGFGYGCDDDDLWDNKLGLYGAKDLEKQLEKKVENYFDTPENREKAILSAKDKIRKLYNALGYNVKFNEIIECDSCSTLSHL